MNKYILFIALVTLRIVYHPSPAQTITIPFDSALPVKTANMPAGINKSIPGAGITNREKTNFIKAAEKNKIATRKFLLFELVWKQRIYYCNHLLKKIRGATIPGTVTITTSA